MTNSSDPIKNRTVNPGDRISKEKQSIEEKEKQLAVDAPDIAGDYLKVPTYFVFEYPNGEKKAFHHVKDAKAISDAIRQARYQEEIDPDTKEQRHHFFNWSAIFISLFFTIITLAILIGVF